MRRSLRVWAAALAAGALCISAGAQQRGQGLKLASKDRLRGIPIADVPYSGTELPARVDLSPNMPPPGQQGAQNSCVAWSVAYALKSYQEKVEERWDYGDGAGQLDGRRIFSPAFIYNQINQGQDGGASMLEAFDLLSSKGAATWAAMPYNERDYLTRPGANANEEAKRYRVNFWRQVNPADVKEVKAQLAAGYPVAFGMLTDEGFLNIRAGQVWSSHQGQMYGGHAMLLVGYDDGRNAFKVMNSWGREWCEGGYGWIAYDFFRQNANEAYIAKDAINSMPVQPTQQTPVPTPAYDPNDNFNPPTQPTPAYVLPPQYRLNISGVWHNVIYPSAPGRYCMEIRGDLTIPPGVGYNGQVVLHMYYDTAPGGGAQIGYPVASTQSAYATVDGRAACGTAQFAIPAGGVTTTWSAILPYDALNLPNAGSWHQDQFGQQFYQPAPVELIATPLLFVDNFGVAQGQWIPYYVMK